MPTNVTKATLTIEGQSPLNCLFNPKDFSVTKANTWTSKASPGKTAVQPTFGGGQPSEMALDLLFDSTLPGSGTVSVMQICTDLFNAMKASKTVGSSARPPTMTFRWGEFSFEGVAKSLAIQYQLFKFNGEPIRVNAKLSLMQWDVESTKGQNPTTRSTGGLGTHVVRDGDSLPSIAFRAYGDATRWRPIAEENGIDDPLSLRSGRVLNVPSLDA
jgi:nucleoid-associated protein YgaU